MEKVWLKSYEEGVPAEINPDAYHSLVEMIDHSCKQFRDQPAFTNMGVTLTYEDLDRLSRDFAAYLQNDLQLKKGDRFAIMVPNLLQYPIVMLGILRAGVMVVNVNPLYTPDELSHQMRDSGAAGILVLENFANTVQKSLPDVPTLKHVIVTKVGDLFPPLKAGIIQFVLKYIHKKIPDWNIAHAVMFKSALAKGKDAPLTPVPISGDDIAFLQYTGGTTGVSKGAMLTHRNMIANLQQVSIWFASLIKEGREVVVTALPLYHIFSLTTCLIFTKLGGVNLLITNPRDIKGMLKTLSHAHFTAIIGVNTLFNAMLKSPLINKLNFKDLVLALGGGMAVQRVVAERWQELTHMPLVEAYGLTECAPCVTLNPAKLSAYNGSIGLPAPSTDVCILDDNHEELPIGQVGELAVKGPQVMKGYWNNPTETAKVFTKDGWLLTGDIASIDEKGFIRLMERKKDMILVSGFNVYPNEIEDIIARLPGVREAAVVASPDEMSGEVPRAFIVRDNPSLTTDNVIAFCRERLTPYKIPKHVEFVDELPKTNVGKILRRALRDMPLHQ